MEEIVEAMLMLDARGDALPTGTAVAAGDCACLRASSGLARETLIPGLPDDLAWTILLRVPPSGIHSLRKVCRRWRGVIPGPHSAYFTDRLRLGLAEQRLYVSVSDWQGANACFVREASSSAWHKLPPIPGSHSRTVLTLQFAAIRGGILVLGTGERDQPVGGGARDQPVDGAGVYRYDPRTNSWSRAASVRTGRWFCMAGVVGGHLYVAGGIGTSNSLALVHTVERYDPVDDSWAEVNPSRRAELVTLPGYQVVLEDKLYAKNIGWGPRLGLCYDPLTGTVKELTNGMVQGWQGPTVSVGNKLLIVDFGDEYKVKAWSPREDKWVALGTLRLPAEGQKPWAVQLVVFQERLCLVLPDLTLAAVPLAAVLDEPPWDSEVEWMKPARLGLSGELASLEPSVLTSAVLGCQVLEI